MFADEMVFPMNIGARRFETALKLARKWGYEKKKYPENEATIIFCCVCVHGCTLAVIPMSCDNEATSGIGTLLFGHVKVDLGGNTALEEVFKEYGDRIAGFLFEPILEEDSVIIPREHYLKTVKEKAARDFCWKYNILMIAHKIQRGLALQEKC